jgi:hypothetical protein
MVTMRNIRVVIRRRTSALSTKRGGFDAVSTGAGRSVGAVLLAAKFLTLSRGALVFRGILF